jgi:hypothetical protein
MMRGRKIIAMGGSSSVGYMRNIADILQKWKDLRNVDIMPNRGDMCNNAGIPKLYDNNF